MDVPELTAANNYDAHVAHWHASLGWLLWEIYHQNIPENLRITEQVPSALRQALTSSKLYIKACHIILGCTPKDDTGVLQSLSRRGIYVLNAHGSAVTPESLCNQQPFNQGAHQALLDSLMWAKAQSLAPVEQVVRAVRDITAFSASAELPSHTEEALLWWLSKASDGLKVCSLLDDLSDGRALALTISHYYPLQIRRTDVVQDESLGIADSLYNLQLVQGWCQNRCLLSPSLDDLFYSPDALRPYLLVFLAQLFSQLTSKENNNQQPKQHPKQAWPAQENLLARVSMDAGSPGSESDSEYLTPQAEGPPIETTRSYTVDQPVFRHLPEAPPQRPGSLQLPKTSFAQIRASSPVTPPQVVTKPPKKTSFAPPPNQTTWQEIVHKCSSPSSLQQQMGEGGQLDMRMQLSERRRQIERNKRQQELELSKQRQRVGKAAFMQVISKDREEEVAASASPRPIAAARYSSSLDKLNTSLSELQGQIMRLSLEQDHIKSIVKEDGGSPSYWLPSDTDRLAKAFRPLHNHSDSSHKTTPPSHCPVPTHNIVANQKLVAQHNTEASTSTSAHSSLISTEPFVSHTKIDAPANKIVAPHNDSTDSNTQPPPVTSKEEQHDVSQSNNEDDPSNVPVSAHNEPEQNSQEEAAVNGFFVGLDSGRPLRPKPKLGNRTLSKPDPAPAQVPVPAPLPVVNGYQPGEVFEVPLDDETSEVEDRRAQRVQLLAQKRRQDMQRAQSKLQQDRERLAQEQREREERAQQKKEEEKQRRQQIFEDYLRRKAEQEAEENNAGLAVRARVPTPKRMPLRPRSQVLESPGSSSQEDLEIPRGTILHTVEQEQEYRGPKLYKKPSQKSNRLVVSNAVSHCCLAGTVNQMLKQQVLEVIAQSESKHFVILFRDGSLQYRGLYSYNPDTQEVVKLQGKGPRQLADNMIEKFYKYDSGAKQFSQVTTTKHMSTIIDAVVLFNHCWQKSRRP